MRRVSRILSFSLQAAFGIGIAAFGTGCGALGALTNPSAMFAIQEPAPMSVVVRRAEVARGTADEVGRLLGATGMEAKSKWPSKTALKTAEADKLLKALGNEPVYGGQHVRVMTAEAWLETFKGICSDEKQYPSLLASITPALAESYGEVSKQEHEIAALKAQVEIEDKAIDDKDQAAQKEEHQKKKKELEEQVSKAEDDYKPKVEKFLSSVREEASKANGEAKERVGVAVVNLKRAIIDAKLSNSVALVRYPLAVPKLSTDAQDSAKRIVGDVLEERLGTRPDMNAIKPDVKLDGAKVKLTIAGISPDKLGSLSIDDVIVETTKRLTAYVERVLTLVPYAGETQDKLGFELKVVEALSEGLKLGAPGADAGNDLADMKIETMGVGKPSLTHKGVHSPVGLVAGACAKPEGDQVAVAAVAAGAGAAAVAAGAAGAAAGGGGGAPPPKAAPSPSPSPVASAPTTPPRMPSPPKSEPTAADKETARALVEDGDKKLRAKDVNGALKSYTAAHEIMGVPTTGLEVAKTMELLGFLIEAREVALGVAQLPVKPNEPGVFAEARRQADALANRIAPRIPSIVITLQPANAGDNAKIELDGASLPNAILGVPRKVNPGTHHIVVSANDFKTNSIDVVLKEAESKPTVIALEAGADAPGTATASKDDSSSSSSSSSDSSKPSYTLAITGFTVGGAGLVFGTITGIMAISAASSAKSGCNANGVCPPGNASDASRASTMAALSDVGLGVALGGAGLGIFGLVTAKPSSTSSATLYLSPNSVGIAGKF